MFGIKSKTSYFFLGIQFIFIICFLKIWLYHFGEKFVCLNQFTSQVWEVPNFGWWIPLAAVAANSVWLVWILAHPAKSWSRFFLSLTMGLFTGGIPVSVLFNFFLRANDPLAVLGDYTLFQVRGLKFMIVPDPEREKMIITHLWRQSQSGPIPADVLADVPSDVFCYHQFVDYVALKLAAHDVVLTSIVATPSGGIVQWVGNHPLLSLAILGGLATAGIGGGVAVWWGWSTSAAAVTALTTVNQALTVAFDNESQLRRDAAKLAALLAADQAIKMTKLADKYVRSKLAKETLEEQVDELFNDLDTKNTINQQISEHVSSLVDQITVLEESNTELAQRIKRLAEELADKPTGNVQNDGRMEEILEKYNILQSQHKELLEKHATLSVSDALQVQNNKNLHSRIEALSIRRTQIEINLARNRELENDVLINVQARALESINRLRRVTGGPSTFFDLEPLTPEQVRVVAQIVKLKDFLPAENKEMAERFVRTLTPEQLADKTNWQLPIFLKFKDKCWTELSARVCDHDDMTTELIKTLIHNRKALHGSDLMMENYIANKKPINDIVVSYNISLLRVRKALTGFVKDIAEWLNN